MTDTLEIFGTEYTGVTGIKATDDNNQTKTYIRPQGTKSITQNGTGIDVSAYATADVSVSAPSPTLQTITKTYTPSTSAVTDTITASSGYDGIEEVDVTVNAVPTATYYNSVNVVPSNIEWNWYVDEDTGSVDATLSGAGTVDDFIQTAGYATTADTFNGSLYANDNYQLSTQAATAITPTESSQTAVAKGKFTTGAVTVNAIPSNYVGSGITQRSSSDLTVSGATVTAPSGYYENAGTKTVPNATPSNTDISELINAGYDFDSATGTFYSWASVEDVIQPITQAGYIATSTNISIYGNTEENEYQLPTQGATTITPTTSSQTAVTAGKYTTGAITVSAMPSGTEGTPTATKGTVSNHAISVTPSVTNSAGYISGGTHSGTAVSVSASELVSGSQTITENDTYDVTNLASVVISVSGGGSSTMSIGTKTTTLSSASNSISFTGLSGNPLAFVVTSSADQTTGGAKAVAVAYDGTSLHGMDITTQAEADTGFTKSYSSGTLTITATSATFEANEYKLVYAYGGSSSDIHTADVQVGSGATSITFSSLSGRPLYFSCVFKSDFSTSSGYQRVIDVVNDGTNTYGHAMDSEANAQTSWSYTYNGSLTITSTGTNNGGYFHQPGYYQLTYAVDPNAVQYETVSKTYRASTSAQSETITPSTGYDAMSEVNISIPAVTQTNLTAGNIKDGTTVSISNGQSNIWSVTGTYSGGGGGDSKNVQVLQSTSRTSSSSLTKVLGDLTVSKTGTYDVYWSGGRSNTSTSYTWGTRLYIDGSGYGTENTTWSNNCQSNHLSNVSLTANQKLSVYARGRTGSYYTFAPMLTIVEA